MSSLMLSGSAAEWRYRTALRRLGVDLYQAAAPRGQPKVAIGVFVDSLCTAERRGRRLAVLERIQREPPRMSIVGGQPVAGQVNDPQHARVVLEHLDRERLGHVQADPLRYFFGAPVERFQTRRRAHPQRSFAVLVGRSHERTAQTRRYQPDRENSGEARRSPDPTGTGRLRWPATTSRTGPG